MLPVTFMNRDSLESFCDELYADGRVMCTISDVDLDEKKNIVYKVVLPRCEPEAVHVQIVDDTLVVSGESTKHGKFLAEYQCNRAMYAYERYRSDYCDGIMTVTVPRVGQEL